MRCLSAGAGSCVRRRATRHNNAPAPICLLGVLILFGVALLGAGLLCWRGITGSSPGQTCFRRILQWTGFVITVERSAERKEPSTVLAKERMERLPSNIANYSGGIFDPLSRASIPVASCVLVWLLNRGVGLTWYGVILDVLLVLTGIIFASLYTEIDEVHIATVFRLGRFCRIEFGPVRWADVQTASVRSSDSSRGPKTVDLVITTVTGRKAVFTASKYGRGADTFIAITKLFHGSV